MKFRSVQTVATIIITLFCFNVASHAADFQVDKVDDELAIIFVSGPIEIGDDILFRQLSLEHPEAVIALDSEGGKLIPAIEIGKAIRLAGYSTIVGDGFLCTSSCALIWLAGYPRFLEPGGSVGFHASYRNKNGHLEQTGVDNAIVGHYLSLLNLSRESVIFATSAKPNEISWLTEQNREESGIDFQTLAHHGEHRSDSGNNLPSRVQPSK